MKTLPIDASAAFAAVKVRPPEPLGRSGRTCESVRTGRGEDDLPAGFPPTSPRIVAGQAAIFAVWAVRLDRRALPRSSCGLTCAEREPKQHKIPPFVRH